MSSDGGPGMVHLTSGTLHLTYGDFDDGLCLEFRSHPADLRSTIDVTLFGECVPRSVTVATSSGVRSVLVRDLIHFSLGVFREEVPRNIENFSEDLGCGDADPAFDWESALRKGSASKGLDASQLSLETGESPPGHSSIDLTGPRGVAATFWTVDGPEREVWVRVPEDLDVWAFERAEASAVAWLLDES